VSQQEADEDVVDVSSLQYKAAQRRRENEHFFHYYKCLKFDSPQIESSRVVTCHSGGGVVIPRADATCNIQLGTGGCCTASVRLSDNKQQATLHVYAQCACVYHSSRLLLLLLRLVLTKDV